jgi:hypothetical protein
MDMLRILGWLALIVISAPAQASLDRISHADQVSGLKQALNDGSIAAVAKLGVQNGFLGNPKVKIPLPPSIQRVESAKRAMGRGKQADDLVHSMNRAAETAVVEAKPLLVDAVKKMSVEDARKILTGGDTAATEYFKRHTQSPLAKRFLPIVKRATDKVGLAQQYNSIAGQGVAFGLVQEDQATIERYVTQKTLDGLYFMIGEQEKNFRKNPVGATSDIVKRVFGAIR